MDDISGLLVTVLRYPMYFLPAITILVFVHELGHFLIARWNGVRVQVFSIGFGREIFGFTDRHGTRWKFSWIPLGGYVKMFGEHAVEEVLHDPKEPGRARAMTAEEKAVSFDHKTLGQRAAIVFAGPAVNFLFAAMLFFGLALSYGKVVPGDFVNDGIGGVVPGSAAEEAGLAPGDRLLSADGTPLPDFDALREVVQASAGRPIRLEVARDDAQFPVTVTPRLQSGENVSSGYVLGVTLPSSSRKDIGILEALVYGPQQTVQLTAQTLSYLWEIATLQRSFKELGGPVQIVEVTHDAGTLGLEVYVFLLAVLSINLGLFNLFPIPMLDGGHLLFYGIHAIRGRPVSEVNQERAYRVGLFLILMLVVATTLNHHWVAQLWS